jgi:hypothetical protein
MLPINVDVDSLVGIGGAPDRHFAGSLKDHVIAKNGK